MLFPGKFLIYADSFFAQTECNGELVPFLG